LDQQIAVVLQIERPRIWRLWQRYIDDGLNAALYERPRSGRPKEYGDQAESDRTHNASDRKQEEKGDRALS
jgi:hypothetical protein